MPPCTTVRIASRRAGRVEVYGEWFVSDPLDRKMLTILTDLREVQQIEPEMNWKLECRGEHSDWHAWGSPRAA